MAAIWAVRDAICACLVFWVVIASSFAINVLQLLSLMLCCSIWSQALASHWWRLSQFITETWSGVRFHFTGDDIFSRTETAVILSNHSPGIDNMPGVCISSRSIGCGSVCTMIKSSLKALPGLGWVNYLQGSLFLSRHWITDRSRIETRLRRLPHPFWVGIFPDGTRMTPEKRAESQRFARERNLPVLKNILTPRTKGFVLAVQTLGPKLDAIYDVTTCYEGSPMYLSDLLFRGGFRTRAVHMHIRRISSHDVSCKDQNLEQWLYSAFAVKDDAIENYKITGTLPGPNIYRAADHKRLYRIFAVWALGLAFAMCYLSYFRSMWAWSYVAVTMMTLYVAFVRMRKRLTFVPIGIRDELDRARAGKVAKLRAD